MASSSRSSPQNSSRPTTNVGDPKMPRSRAASVSAARAAFVVSVLANASTRSGSCPISRKLSDLSHCEPAPISCADKFRSPSLAHAQDCNQICEYRVFGGVRRRKLCWETVHGSAALDITPHIRQFGRLIGKRHVLHFLQNDEKMEWAPMERNPRGSFDIGKPQHAQIRVRAAHSKPEVNLRRSHLDFQSLGSPPPIVDYPGARFNRINALASPNWSFPATCGPATAPE
jgi:hypothetical protein